jgi:hemolysin D
VIVAGLTIFIAWSSFDFFDIITECRGQIIVSARTQEIRSPVEGVVGEIFATDGQAVRDGSAILALDPSQTTAERRRYERSLAELALVKARTEAFFANRPVLNLPDEVSEDDRDLLTLNSHILSTSLDDLAAKLVVFDRQRAQAVRDRETERQTSEKSRASLPLLELQVNAKKELADRGLVAKVQFWAEEQSLVELQHDLLVSEARVASLTEAIDLVDAQRQQVIRDTQLAAMKDLEKQAQDTEVSIQELAKAKTLEGRHLIIAHGAGTLVNLTPLTEGAYVAVGEVVGKLVPSDSEKQVELFIDPKNIGFIKTGSAARIKIEAYPFVKHGSLKGHVVSVSGDASVFSGEGSAVREGSPPGQTASAPMYRVVVGLDGVANLDEDISRLPLVPGMSVTGDIVTGRRNLMSYFLDPFSKFRDQSFSEQ